MSREKDGNSKKFITRNYYRPTEKSLLGLRKKPATKSISKINSSKVQSIEFDGEITELPSLDLGGDGANKSGVVPKKAKKKLPKFWRFFIKMFVLILIAALVYAGFYVYKILTTSSRVVEGNIISAIFSTKPLKKDENQRTNVLIFGTAEDDGEDGHRGNEYLTDSIMIVSFDEANDDVAMISLPRDLWVKLDKPCTVGYQEKLNTVFMCGSNNGQDEKAGAQSLMGKVKEITGIEIQYYVHVNFGGVVALVDAVDGLDIDVMGYGPVPYGVEEGSILDRNFDWKCNYRCHYVNYEPGTHHMDGEHALAFIRARNANGGYGLPNSNFDREKNQQKVINALMTKMLSAGTLADFGKFSKIIDAIGQNLRTNLVADELRAVTQLAQKVNFSSARSILLINEKRNLVGTGTSVKGTSMVRPSAGLFSYTEIHSYLRQELLNDGISEEAARIGVFNAGNQAGAAKKMADKILDENMRSDQVGNASNTACAKEAVSIYALGDAANTKSRSLVKLQKISGGKLMNCEIDFNYDMTLDFLVVIQ